MKKFIFFSVLLILTLHSTYFRLNTNQISKLSTGDSLISTLGYFKATLLQIGCTLQISSIKNSIYIPIGNYTSPNISGNCKSLTIIDGQIVTQSNTTYMSIGTGFNLSTIFTIDDYGIMRLIGTYLLPNYVDQISIEYTITDYYQNQTYIYPTSNLSVNFINSFSSITNNNNWVFSASAGELSISQINNNGIYVSYSYASFTINNSIITDFNGNTFPAAIFPNITYTPRCTQPRLYLNFKPPFLFVADPYWPIFTLYQQGRYKILQVSLETIYDNQAWNNQYKLQVRNQPNPCPSYTFQYKGTCISICPLPYYHQMRGIYGYCVLTCEEYTPKNQTTRICSCYSEYQSIAINILTNNSCGNGSVAYPYGCYCNTTGKYYDRLLTLSCVSNCPSTTFASNGLCMQCPKDCQTCQIDKLYRSYLECRVCMPGFSIVNGNCYRTCNPGLGYSNINGVCQQCSDENCINCTQNANICITCGVLFALQGTSCVQTCSNTTTLSIADGFASTCIPNDPSCSQFLQTHYKGESSLKCITCQGSLAYMHLDKCVSSCPSGYISNSANTCYCSQLGTITVSNKCLSIPTCPIQMGWDPLSNSCLTCNFGCLTCYNSACTSCSPGYFHYISPQGIRCRRKSPLFTCDTQYGWVNGVCLVLQYSDPNLGLTQCYSSISSCKACSPGRSDVCILCNTGLLLHNNTCISTCPTGTQPYNGQTCILLEISNCSQPYLKLNSEPFVLNYDKISTTPSPYQFYTFNGKEPSNDPVGYIPIYQQLIDRKNDGQFRNSDFYHPSWTCLKCNDGLGMSNDFSSCLPCPLPCATCYMAQNNSCLTLLLPTNCQYYIDSQTNQCVQSCSSSTSLPQLSNGILYCTQTDSTSASRYARIDSSIFTAPDGRKMIFFVLDQSIKTSGNINLNVIKQGTIPLVGASSDSRISAGQGVPLIDGNHVMLQDTNANNNLYLLNLTGQVPNLLTQNNLLFPNTVYGANVAQSHPQFMKTWLAYIGYIMGITLILLHAVFIGNDLLYKVDNAIILAQSIYFFSFTQLLVGKLLAQFYYGWIFTHFGFFPNFFKNTIPSAYYQPNSPNSYKLATLDTNIIRNAGFAFSLLLVFICGYMIITLICWLLAKCCNKPQAWYPKIAANALIAGIQFISMTIFYWSVACLLYIKGAENIDNDFYHTSKSVSIVFICIIIVYSILRWFFHPLGGLYMIKRILLATILAATYQDVNMLAPLIILQVVFTIFRFCMQTPQKTKQKCYLFFECILYIGTYILLSLCVDAGVNTVIISIFIFIIIVALAYDLTEVYLQSRNEWLVQQEEDDENETNMAKAEANNKKRSSVVKAY